MAIHALQIKKPAGSEVQKPGSASVASKSKDKRKYNQMDLLISSLAEMKPAMNREKAPLFEHEEQLQFEFILSTLYQQPRGFTLEMRVGYKHRYVVTKLGQFLEHLEQRKPLYFTSKFTFDAEQQQIGAADREFLEVMLLLKNSEKLLKPSPNSYYNPLRLTGER